MFLLCSVKWIVYVFSADSVCSNPSVGPLQRIKISFLLLSIFADELMPTSKIITFLPVLPLGCEKKIYFYQIQFHIQNIYADQCQDV